MNRIPNYRVWHKIEKRFVDLRSIDFEKESIGYDAYREGNYYDVAKFDKIIFQQFTGLYDKNKKPIYEGDRVRFTYVNVVDMTGGARIVDVFGEVQWCKNTASFGVLYEKYIEFKEMTNVEVVGNIFQLPCNPDHNGECLVCDCWLCDCPFNKENKD